MSNADLCGLGTFAPPNVLAVEVAGYQISVIPIGLIIWLAWIILKRVTRSPDQASGGATRTGSASGQSLLLPAGGVITGSDIEGALKLRTWWVMDDDEWPVPHYEVQCVGAAPLRHSAEMAFRHRLLDVTDPDEPKPIMALLDWQQAGDTVAFLDVTPLGTASSITIEWSQWSSMRFPIFAEMIRTPRSGERTLLSFIDLIAMTDDGVEVLWQGTTTTTITVPGVGYEEYAERAAEDDLMIVRLGVAVAASAEGISTSETQVIEEWTRSRVSLLDEADPTRRQRHAAMAEALQRSLADSAAGRLDLEATVRRFVSTGTEEGRVQAVELALAVMRADGEIATEEMAMINRLADEFEIDPEWFAETRDKSMHGASIEAGSADEYSTLLGIDRNADREAIRKQLAEQYDRWNSRAATLEDPDQRRRAEEMLELIAKARKELL